MIVCPRCKKIYNPLNLRLDDHGRVYRCPSTECVGTDLIEMDDRLVYVVMRLWMLGLSSYATYGESTFDMTTCHDIKIKLPEDQSNDLEYYCEQLKDYIDIREEQGLLRVSVKEEDQKFNYVDTNEVPYDRYYKAIHLMIDNIKSDLEELLE